MKAFISEILWVDEDGDEVEHPDSMPKAAFLELPDNDLDQDEFCEIVDNMLKEAYNCQPGGFQWEIIDVTH